MKNCEEFQKEIFLKIYTEDYDPSLDAHLKECALCEKFYAESNAVFKDNPPVDEIKLAAVKNKITKNSRVFKFNLKPFYAAAAAVLIITMSVLIYKSPSPEPELNDYALIINEEIINNEKFTAMEQGLIALETEINAGLFNGLLNDV